MSQSNASVVVTCAKCRRECSDEAAEYLGQGVWLCAVCAGAEQQQALADCAEVLRLAAAIRRPQCGCCGYEAPLPTLRQFDGLCLGCYEEAERLDDQLAESNAWQADRCNPLYGYEPCAGCNKPCQNGVCAACEVPD